MKEGRDVWLKMEDAELFAECHADFHKSSGRGGQKVNKTSSAVRLYHMPSGLTVNCSESRSQMDNRRIALDKLRLSIALSFREKPFGRPPLSDPPPSMYNAPRYAFWAAKILDFLADSNWDVKEAAERLNLTRSKLTKLLERDSALLRVFRSAAAKLAEPIEVCAAVLRIDGKVVICSRTKKDKFSGYMEFPGGKVEEDESHQNCLIREIREELGSEIEVGNQIWMEDHDYGDKCVRLFFYEAVLKPGSPLPEPKEKQVVKMVDPKTLPKQKLLPADRKFAEFLAEENGTEKEKIAIRQ